MNYLDMVSDTQLLYIWGVPDAATGTVDSSQLFLSQYDRHLEQWTADLHAKGNVEAFGRTHQLVLGTDWSESRNQQESRYPTTALTEGLPPLEEWDGSYPEPESWAAFPTTVGDATIRERGLYSAGKLDLADRWTAVVGARVRWQDDIDRERDFADGKTRQDAYALLDLMASYDFSDHLTGSLNVNNVTDEKYLTSLKWDQAFSGAPRHVQASLTWTY